MFLLDSNVLNWFLYIFCLNSVLVIFFLFEFSLFGWKCKVIFVWDFKLVIVFLNILFVILDILSIWLIVVLVLCFLFFVYFEIYFKVNNWDFDNFIIKFFF